MANQDIKGYKIKFEPKNDQKPVPDLHNKVNDKQKTKTPILTDDTRVVFSEEINRDSNLDDG